MMLFNFLWATTLFFLLLRLIGKSTFFYHRRVHPLLFQILFIIKVFAGIGMTLIYTNFYTDRKTADIFKYFDDSEIMVDALKQGNVADFAKMFSGIDSRNHQLDKYYIAMRNWDDSETLYNDNRIMIRFNAVLRFVSFGNYYIHMLVMCFITLYGLTCLFHLFAGEMKEKFMGIFSAIFLMPSVIFWNSGMLKDGLLLTALCVFLFLFNKSSYSKLKFWEVIQLITALLLLILIKSYVMVITLPALVLIYFIKKTNSKQLNNWGVWFLCYGTWFSIMFLFGRFIYGTDPMQMLIKKQQGFFELVSTVPTGSYFRIATLHSLQDVIINAPAALFNVLFRPFIFETRSPLVIIAAFENILIILFAVFCFWNRSRTSPAYSYLKKYAFFFVILLYILIGLVVPVAGAVVRYKVTALPFLMLFFVMMYDEQKVHTRLRKLKLIA